MVIVIPIEDPKGQRGKICNGDIMESGFSGRWDVKVQRIAQSCLDQC